MIPTSRMRRSETCTGSSLCPTGIKRAPSFGSSRNSLESVAMSIDFDAKNSDGSSSDEEEKLRARNAKRVRRKAASPTLSTPLGSPTLPTSSPKADVHARATPQTPSKLPTRTTLAGKDCKPLQPRTSRPKANLQRNPSILGPELPNPQLVPTSPPAARRLRFPTGDVPKIPASPVVYQPVSPSPYSISSIPPVTPQSSRALRRSRPTAPLPRASLARKISFGNLISTQDEMSSGSGAGLGSAFQLH
jgi:hypothetical protein